MTDIVDEIRARISKMTHSRLNDAYLMDRAAQEIERLRDVCDDLYSDLLAAGSLTPQDCGAYALIQETIRLRRDRWARKQTPNAKVSGAGAASAGLPGSTARGQG